MSNLRRRFDRATEKKKLLEENLANLNLELKALTANRDIFVKSRWVLSEVAKLTQEKFKERVESLVTMAIRSVFDRPFKFVLEFERRRNQLEAKPFVMEGTKRLTPKEDMGGSIIDIISFAFRVVLWSLERPRSRNVLIEDEPMKWTGELSVLAGRVIKEISGRLNMQVIMPTHDKKLIEIGDRVWHVEHDGTKSVVKQLEDGALVKSGRTRRTFNPVSTGSNPVRATKRKKLVRRR